MCCIVHCFHYYTASAKYSQLEADKKFLEEELKCGGRRRSTAVGTRQQLETNDRGKASLTPPSSNTTVHSSSPEDNAAVGSSDSSVGSKSKEFGSNKQAETVTNFLEDLDAEFSKQKSQAHSSDVVGATTECVGVENIRPAKVIRVSKENVNQCPQQ